jgi:hypothetical protein
MNYGSCGFVAIIRDQVNVDITIVITGAPGIITGAPGIITRF